MQDKRVFPFQEDAAMDNPDKAVSVPVHFWVIAVLSLLWHAVGAADYIATQLEIEAWLSGFSEEQLAYFLGFPKWVVAFWAISIWTAVFGSLALLLRRSWAFHLFVASLIAMLVTAFHNFVLSNGAEIMGMFGVAFSLVILAINVFLIVYSRAMIRRGVLR